MQGIEYVYETSWGEQLSSVVNPLPVVLNLCTEECTVLDTFQVGDISCKCKNTMYHIYSNRSCTQNNSCTQIVAAPGAQQKKIVATLEQ